MATLLYTGDPSLLGSSSDGQQFAISVHGTTAPSTTFTFHPGTAFDDSLLGGTSFDVTQVPGGGTSLGFTILVESVGD